MTKNTTEPSRKHCQLLNGRDVSVFTHHSPEKDVLPSVFPNSATISSKPSFQNGFKPCAEGWGQSGCSCNHIYPWHPPSVTVHGFTRNMRHFLMSLLPCGAHSSVQRSFILPSHRQWISSMFLSHLAELVKHTVPIRVLPVPVSSQKWSHQLLFWGTELSVCCCSVPVFPARDCFIMNKRTPGPQTTPYPGKTSCVLSSVGCLNTQCISYSTHQFKNIHTKVYFL